VDKRSKINAEKISFLFPLLQLLSQKNKKNVGLGWQTNLIQLKIKLILCLSFLSVAVFKFKSHFKLYHQFETVEKISK